MPGSNTYEGCALANQFNLSEPQSTDCTMGLTTVSHCKVCCDSQKFRYYLEPGPFTGTCHKRARSSTSTNTVVTV